MCENIDVKKCVVFVFLTNDIEDFVLIPVFVIKYHLAEVPYFVSPADR
jgi:hypothetical protein